jgi:NitT/TauT family transport system ATP-binding protein
MRQRLALARALSVEPRIILMDEPFAAVDALTRERLQEDLLRLWQETKKTIVLVTHDVDEAVYLSDEVVVFSPLPGSIRNKVTVDIPRPRRRSSSEIREIKERLLAMYRYDTVHESDYSI